MSKPTSGRAGQAAVAAPPSPKTLLVIEFDREELACRIAEHCMGMKRPAGRTPKQALSQFPPDIRDGFYRAATASLAYLQERSTAGRVPS